MARIRLVPRDEITNEFTLARWQQIFGDGDPAVDTSMIGPNETRGDYWSALANSPETVKHVWDGFGYLKSHTLQRVHREIGIARAGYAVGSKFVFSQHCKALRGCGWSDEKVESLTLWQSASCFDELERLLLAVADDLVLADGRIPERRFAALRDHLSDREIVEFIHATLMYQMHATVCRALRVEYDDIDDHVSESGARTYEL